MEEPIAVEPITKVICTESDLRSKYPVVWNECVRLERLAKGVDAVIPDDIRIPESEREGFYRVFASDPYRPVIDAGLNARLYVLDMHKLCLLKGRHAQGINKAIDSFSSIGKTEKCAAMLKQFPDVTEWFEKNKEIWICRPTDGCFKHSFAVSEVDLRKRVEKVLAIGPLRNYFQTVQRCKILYHENRIEIHGKLVELARRRAIAANAVSRPPTSR